MTGPGQGLGGQPRRLARGGMIDRTRSLAFRFDGRSFTGQPGDTLASALLANGVRLVGRSFKYHRPRGIMAAGPEEPNALVELRTGDRREPNTRATGIELFDGLEAASQNRWPSLSFDLRAVNGWAAPLLKAGFYYKTFMWPSAFWERVYEPLIRRAAGLGRASGVPDPDRYEKATAHCDVLVIGSGPAGLMAALTAGRAGARVILAEQDFVFGGSLRAERTTLDGRPASAWLEAILAELAALGNVRLMPRTTVFGTYDQRCYGAVERVTDHLAVPDPWLPRQRVWRFVARHAVLATGAIERPIAFGNNDRPGVMLAGAVRTYLHRFAVRPGERAVVFASGGDAARTTADLAAAGVAVAAVVDPHPEGSLAARTAAGAVEARYFAGGTVLAAKGSRHGVAQVVVLGPEGESSIDCDLVAVSGGWNPAIHLASHLGHKPVWNPQIAAFVPDRLPDGMVAAGAAAGVFALAAALDSGAGAAARGLEGEGRRAEKPAIPEADDPASSNATLWRAAGARGPAFVDFQNDVTVADVKLAEQEGFRAAEHMKRYTTLGMATDQGKTSGVAGTAVLAELTARPIEVVGVTTYRPPFTPVAIGALAGHHRGPHYRPTRRTPTHAWAAAHRAVFVEAGPWLRAQYFPSESGEDWLAAALREARAVRERVGICDVSTLGKIDVQGPDAGRFLDFVYANTMSTLPVGRARYGLMLREDGFVFDDGTVSRPDERCWIVTTTTANAGRVMQHLDFCRQVLRPDLDVQLVSVTDQWCQLAVAGPRSRELLARVLARPEAIENGAFPYMAAGRVALRAGLEARLFRLSFSGELGYEIAVPARYGDALARLLITEGEDLGVAPYGTEALSMLRIEKGHPAGGELNGQTTAHDLGLGKLLSTKKDFVGRRMAARPALTDPGRQVLVGIEPVDKAAPISAGAHVLAEGAEPVAANDLGHVTSTAHSPVFGHVIGLALVAAGRSRLGERLVAHDLVRRRVTRVVLREPVFYDPAGERLRV